MSEMSSGSEQTNADKARFMRTVRLAMSALQLHPDAQVTGNESGKPIDMSLVDDVELPEGDARVWVRVHPSRDPNHPNQPVTELTVADQFDTYSTEDPDIKLLPVTRIRFYADGAIGVIYGETVEDMDTFCDNYYGHEKDFDQMSVSLINYFETNVAELDHTPHAYGEGHDLWDHVSHVEATVEALVANR